MATEFLDKSGLSYFWGKVKAYVNSQHTSVSVTQTVSTGTKIGTVTVNGSGTDLYAPDSGGTTLLYTKDVADTATSTNNVVQNNVANNNAIGGYALAEGDFTRASGYASHAEGSGSIASGIGSHAEGSASLAGGDSSHAEGNGTIAGGENSHAEGDKTWAEGVNAHASGLNTLAQRANQTVIGKNNVADTDGTTGADLGKYVFIIGNGATENSRSNAFTVDWNGNVDIPSGAKYKINGTNLAPSDLGEADYVTAQGTSGAWKYRKWNSGKVEAWAYISFTSTTPAVWASPIRYIDKTFTIPSGIFASAPRMTGSSNSNQYWAVDVSASSSTAGSVRFCTVASSALTPYIQIYAWTD